MATNLLMKRTLKMKLFKRVYNIDELNAIRTQYDNPIRKKEIFVFALVPALYVFSLIYSLFYNWKLALGFSLIGVIYGLAIIMPKMVKRNHYSRSQRERNRFMNSLTQNLVNDNVLTEDGLERVSNRLNGELARDIKELTTRLKYDTAYEQKKAYEALSDKYKNDRVFVQFIDQLNTATNEGRNNISELDSLASHHDLVLQKQKSFYNVKDEKLLWYCVASGMIIAVAITLALTTWNLGYRDIFIGTPIGWFIGFSFIIFNLFYTHKFVGDYFDDEVMEVKN